MSVKQISVFIENKKEYHFNTKLGKLIIKQALKFLISFSKLLNSVLASSFDHVDIIVEINKSENASSLTVSG